MDKAGGRITLPRCTQFPTVSLPSLCLWCRYVSVGMCPSVWRDISLITFHLIFLRQGLSVNLVLHSLAKQLANEFQAPAWLLFPSAGTADACPNVGVGDLA